MQNATAWVLFVVFGLVLFLMYVAIRRRWTSPLLIAALGVIASVVIMTLTGLAQGNTIYQAIFVGLLVGGLFSGGTLAMASYFHSAEQRRTSGLYQPPDEGQG